MRYFVSYARRDNDVARLREIESLLSGVGHAYIDDLEDHADGVDRVKVVVDALSGADALIAVLSDGYLTTEWTKWEFDEAQKMGIQILALLPDGLLVARGDPAWPWATGAGVPADEAAAS